MLTKALTLLGVTTAAQQMPHLNITDVSVSGFGYGGDMAI